MHIGIIGTGYVGLVTGACFAEFGLFVTCVDKDEKKIRLLKKGEIPFYEPGIGELVKRNLKQGRLQFTKKVEKAVESSLVIFIAVGTPRRGDGSADLKYVEDVATAIAKAMDGYKVIVTKSTVPVGTGEKIQDIISRNLNGKIDFDIVSNPEFLREGSALEDFMRPNRVVIGAKSAQAVAIMRDLYKPLYLIETPFVITNVETAEMIKYASNSFLATKISFINEMATLCERVGADVHTVAKGMGLDQRIGSKFLHPGPGYGGSCLPKDTNALIRIAEGHGIELSVIGAAVRANEKQRKRMVQKIMSAMGVLKGKTVAILGLSFKPNTDDIRDAPSISIIHALLKEKANIRAYDPVSMEEAAKVCPNVKYCRDSYDTVKGADAVVIMTEWNQFRNLEFDRLANLMKGNYFFDLRNVYDPQKLRDKGFQYVGVGRG
jgi:UDPglucose 6-dehydrogenase